jgi:hypothetical protein
MVGLEYIGHSRSGRRVDRGRVQSGVTGGELRFRDYVEACFEIRGVHQIQSSQSHSQEVGAGIAGLWWSLICCQYLESDGDLRDVPLVSNGTFCMHHQLDI